MKLLARPRRRPGAAALRGLRALLPPPRRSLCTRCARRLAAAEPLRGAGPPGIDRAWSSAPHEGVARDLVAALKFRRLLPVAELMAERIEWLAPAAPARAARSSRCRPRPLRSLRRGFDPAAEIAAALADALGRRCGPACAAAAPAARSAGAAPSDSAGRRGSSARGAGPAQRPPRRRRAHHRRDALAPAPGPCAAPARSGSSQSPSRGGCETAAVDAVRGCGGRSIASDRPRRHICGSRYVGATSRSTDELREHVLSDSAGSASRSPSWRRSTSRSHEERNPSIADSQVAEATLRLKGVTLRATRPRPRCRTRSTNSPRTSAARSRSIASMRRKRTQTRARRRPHAPSVRTA